MKFDFVYLGQTVLKYQVPLEIFVGLNEIYEKHKKQLPKANKVSKQTIDTTQQIGSVETAKKLTLGFELVGIRGNNPESTIIILDKNNYKLVEQGENISNQISFSHIEGSRAYFFDGKDYSFLDIIGSEKSFNQDRIDLIKD